MGVIYLLQILPTQRFCNLFFSFASSVLQLKLMPALISTLQHIPGEICGGWRKKNHQPVCSRLQEKENNLLSWRNILIKQSQLLIWRSVSKRPSSKYEILARKAQTKGLTVTFRAKRCDQKSVCCALLFC